MNPEIRGMLAVPDSAGGAEVVPWVERLEEPHPEEVLLAAGALATVTATRTRALMIAYTLFDAGLLASDRPVVELPDPTRWYDDGDGRSVPVWEVPGGVVWAWPGGALDTVDRSEDLDAVEQRAFAILAAVAYAPRLAAGSPDGGGDGAG